ncbi:unnamed protein product [Spirodela intermedia]|uniref:Uncharacterized protein n=2 Tax=Spirodela intermedia TaxID=51605 RepID=A0A7I8L7A3_SPIIN|nr:unnamed protein product [Spirodela intermedia]CAA6668354.1 unnamed protein product [Spirodela intermedia]CAA7405198.1 unnamed protein product [Spirodela intermedia]
MTQKYMMLWTRMEMPLVAMFPNSTTRVLAGAWNSSPGDSRMNITTATIIGPQSIAISLSLSLSLSRYRADLIRARPSFFHNCA